MKPSRFYVPQDAIFPFKGLNSYVPATLLDTRYSPSMLNVKIADGVLEKRGGYQAIGPDITGKVILALIDFDSDTQRHFVAVCTDGIYRIDGTGAPATWIEVTGSTWACSTSYPITFITSTGDIGGSIGKYLIISNGRPDASGYTVYWDGSADNNLSDFSALVAVTYTGFTAGVTLETYFDRIFIGNLYHSGNHYRKDIIWSDIADFDDWSSANAGSVSLTDVIAEIRQIKRLGDRLVVYGDETIGIINYIGGTGLFEYRNVLSGILFAGTNYALDVGNVHLLFTKDNVLMYRGGLDVFPIGEPIKQDIKDNISRTDLSFGNSYYDPLERKAYFIMPISDSASLQYVADVDLVDPRNVSWAKYDLSDRPSLFGLYTEDTLIRWNSTIIATTTWDSVPGELWSDFTGALGSYPSVAFCSGAYCFMFDTSVSDGGANIDAYWETKDFAVPKAYRSLDARWLEVEAELKGLSGVTRQVDVQYSIDQGSNWSWCKQSSDGSNADGVSLATSWTRYRFLLDVSSELIRLRFREAGTKVFHLRWLRIWGTPGSLS